MRLNQPKSAGEKRKKHAGRIDGVKKKGRGGGGLLGSTPRGRCISTIQLIALDSLCFFEPFVSSSSDSGSCADRHPPLGRSLASLTRVETYGYVR